MIRSEVTERKFAFLISDFRAEVRSVLSSIQQKYLYADRPVSRRYHMDVSRRAKQFAPFAALRGLDETIRRQETIYESRKFLSEEKKHELDMKLRMLTYGMKIEVTYFVENGLSKNIGQYRTLLGKIGFFDPKVYLRINETQISVSDIFDLSGDVFEVLETPC